MFLTNLLREKRSAVWQNPPEIFTKMFGGDVTLSGAQVNEQKTLSLTAAWAAIMIIARTMGVFPLPIYRRLGSGGKERAPDHRLYRVLHSAPNPYMTAFNWRFLMAAHQCLWGAGVSEIEFDAAGNPVALWPLPPWALRPAATPSGEIFYEYTDAKGRTRKLWTWQLLILPYFAKLDGGWLSPVGIHRETLGSALAVREFGARTFGQGVNPAAVVSGVDYGAEEKQATFEEMFASYSGLGNAHRLMVLESGVKFERVGLPPEDAQYLETRKFDVEEIARIYNVPLFMLQAHEKSTSWGSGISEIKDGFITFTMQPICTQWEYEINNKLLGDNDEFYCKFTMDGLLRGNIKDRMIAYKTAASLGIYDVNEMRELEDRNPLPDDIGKVRLVPMNMMPLEMVAAGKGGNEPVQKAV
jgi:HK97 family phage portal protein